MTYRRNSAALGERTGRAGARPKCRPKHLECVSEAVYEVTLLSQLGVWCFESGERECDDFSRREVEKEALLLLPKCQAWSMLQAHHVWPTCSGLFRDMCETRNAFATMT